MHLHCMQESVVGFSLLVVFLLVLRYSRVIMRFVDDLFPPAYQPSFTAISISTYLIEIRVSCV